MQSINHLRKESTAPNETTNRLRTVTGNRYPRKCSCGCGQAIPRDPAIRLVVDSAAPLPFFAQQPPGWLITC